MVQEGQRPRLKVRGLTEGYQATPLREFKGNLDHATPRHDDQYNRTMVDLGFTDVEVIESTEPYSFPIAQISIRYSEKKNSTWGIFSAKLEALLGPDEGIEELAEAHTRMHLKMTPDHKFGTNRDTGEEIIISCWEVEGIEGRSESGSILTPVGQALNLLDGRAENDWNQVVLADPVVKKDAALVQQILSKTFLPAMMEQGKISKDTQGVWHLAQETAVG